MPLLVVQNPGKRTVESGKEKRLTYYMGSMQVVQIGVRVHPVSSVRAGVRGKGSKGDKWKEMVLIKYFLCSGGGSTPEHDYVIRSRSRDRSFSACENRVCIAASEQVDASFSVPAPDPPEHSMFSSFFNPHKSP